MPPKRTAKTVAELELTGLSEDGKRIVAAITQLFDDLKDEFRVTVAEKDRQIGELEADVVYLKEKLSAVEAKDRLIGELKTDVEHLKREVVSSRGASC
jgi:hypothetical protein